MSLGQALRKARQMAGLTQEALAHSAGIDRTYVNLLEQDQRSPSVKVFVDICKAMGVPAGDVLNAAAPWISKQPRSGRGRQPDTRRKA